MANNTESSTEPVTGITQEDIDNDKATRGMLKFYDFCKDLPTWPPFKPIKIRSRFVEAEAARMSNPYHEEPFRRVETMEDIIATKNRYEVADQLKK